jgi:hypothetical protein
VAARDETIAQIETGYRHRIGGESKVSGDMRASMKAGYRILAVLGRVMVRQIQATLAGALLGLVVALIALGGFSWWLLTQAPSGPAVLVSTWLLAPPLLLCGALAGAVAGRIARRGPSMRVQGGGP